jgi:hypothetical protein
MKIGEAFPSAYIKATDLNGQRVKIKMHRVVMEDVGDDHKPVLYFYGTEKKMVLNKTNANEITDAYGDDTVNWDGQVIELYHARVDFGGKKVDAIRVNAAINRPSTALAGAAQAPLGQAVQPSAPPRAEVFNQVAQAPLDRRNQVPGNGSDFPGDTPLPEASPFHEDKIPF